MALQPTPSRPSRWPGDQSRQARTQVGLRLALASGLSLLPLAAPVSAAPISAALAAAAPGEATALVRLLDSGRCGGCRLQESDLAQADLRRATLQGADLRHANLSGAQLEGINLRGADLRGASLQGADLQDADLRGAQLAGTDLRESQLGGARIDPEQFRLSHWQGARGFDPALLTYADLHNAGVNAAQRHQHPEAERWFSAAIARQPEAAISWVARGLSRSEQGNLLGAAADFRTAARLLAAGGDAEPARELTAAADRLERQPAASQGGTGVGTQMLGGALAVFQFLAPLAAKALLPMAL